MSRAASHTLLNTIKRQGTVIKNYKVTDLTHSSITRPSPTMRGPLSSGGFLRASSAASASASWRFSLSICLKNVARMCKPNLMFLKSCIALRKKKNELLRLTGLGRSASKNTTRKICSTATWSFCSSNCNIMLKLQLTHRYDDLKETRGGFEYTLRLSGLLEGKDLPIQGHTPLVL